MQVQRENKREGRLSDCWPCRDRCPNRFQVLPAFSALASLLIKPGSWGIRTRPSLPFVQTDLGVEVIHASSWAVCTYGGFTEQLHYREFLLSLSVARFSIPFVLKFCDSPVVCDCCCLVVCLCLTLCDPMDCSPPGSSVCGISQARILEWVAIPFSRGSF